MFRKIALGFATAATLTVLATSGALAHGSHGGGGGHGMHGGGMHSGGNWHGGYGHHRFYRSSFFGGGSCYKTVFTSMGPRRVNVCGDVF